MSQDVAGGRRDRVQYGGGSLQVWWRQCARSQDVAGGRRDRGQYGGGSV